MPRLMREPLPVRLARQQCLNRFDHVVRLVGHQQIPPGLHLDSFDSKGGGDVGNPAAITSSSFVRVSEPVKCGAT